MTTEAVVVVVQWWKTRVELNEVLTPHRLDGKHKFLSELDLSCDFGDTCYLVVF